MSFTTATAAPTVRTLAVVTETDGHKTLNGAANPHGIVGAGWFLYGTTDPGTCTASYGMRVPATDIAIASGHTDAMYETTLGTLAPGTYYYCAVASNSVGTTYGAVVSFVVPQPLPDGGTSDGGPDGGTGGTGGAGGAGGAGGRGGAGGTGGAGGGTGGGVGGGDAGVDASGGAGGASGRGGAGGGTGGSPADGGGTDAGQPPPRDKGCGCGFASASPGFGGILATLLIGLGLTVRRRRRR